MIVTNSRAKATWIHYIVNGVPKKVFLNAHTSLDIPEITNEDQFNLNSIDEGLINNIARGKNYKNLSNSERTYYADGTPASRTPITYDIASVTRTDHSAFPPFYDAYSNYKFNFDVAYGDVISTFESDKGLEVYKDGVLFLTLPYVNIYTHTGTPIVSNTSKQVYYNGTNTGFMYSVEDATYDLGATYTIKTVY